MSLTELTGNPRHDRLLMLIDERGYMNIDELASLLEVSTQTVRRDIRKLSEQGLITRHHGGAGRASSVVNTAFEQREVSWTQEKKAIAEAVADYIPDGSTIFITIGTTVEQVRARCSTIIICALSPIACASRTFFIITLALK